MGNVINKDKIIFPEATFMNHSSAISCIAVCDDKSMIATASDDCTIRTWTTKLQDERCTGLFKKHEGHVTCMAFQDIYLISGSADCTLIKWDMGDCSVVYIYRGHEGRIQRVICSDQFIFSSSIDKTARAWQFDLEDDYLREDVTTAPEYFEEWPCIKTFRGHHKSVVAIVFLPDEESVGKENPGICYGDTLITGSSDGNAISWSFYTGQIINMFHGHTKPISQMVVSGDRTILYTASTDTTIRMWNISTGSCIRTLTGNQYSILCLHLTAGNLLFAGDNGGEVHCYMAHTGDKFPVVYRGHQHSVVAVKFYNGKVYTACSDTKARAFDATTGELKYEFRGHCMAVTGLALIEDRRHEKDTLFTISSDHTLRRWKLSKPSKEEIMESEARIQFLNENSDDEDY